MTETTTTTHVFDSATDPGPVVDNSATGRTHPAYANMVGPFGGITAATLLRAVRQHPDVLGSPVSLTVNYAGPITDGPFDISVRPTRTNRSTQHWSLELTQNGEVTTTATAVTALRRPTWSATEASIPTAPPAAELAITPLPDYVAWAKNYEMRFTEGTIPGPDATEHPDSRSTMWVRDAPARPLDYASLTAMADSFYPRSFLRLGRPMAAGTVSLTVYFHADADTVAAHGTEPVLGTAHTQQFSNGFFDQSAQLWGRDDTLLATSHQIVYFKP